MVKKLTNLLVQLSPDVVINGSQAHPHSIELFISFPERPRICLDCGSFHCNIKGSAYRQTVRHVPSGGIAVLLTFSKHRYICLDCGRSFYEQPEWLHPSLRISMNLWTSVCFDLMEMLSRTAVARKNAIPESLVDNILSHMEFPKPSSLPETLCIDEFKGDSGSWDVKNDRWDREKFHCNIADAHSGVVIDVLPVIRADDLHDHFFTYSLYERKKVKFFCCDMHNGYINVAKTCFPDAVICIDMFHVVKRLSDAMDAVRRRLQNDTVESAPESYELLKHLAKALTTREDNQERLWLDSCRKKRDRLEKAFTAFPDLRAMYDALQGFHHINAMNSYTLQKAELTDWIRDALSSEVPELRSAANTIKHWRSYIHNSWKHGKSNGTCEGLNNKIKVLKRISFGVHDFGLFRKRILLSCGSIRLLPQNNDSLLSLLDKPKKGDNSHE